MKASPLFLLCGLLAGCASPQATLTYGMSPERAHSVAVALATAEAASHFGVRPFIPSTTPVFRNGQWTWSERRPCGTVDLEATVAFQADGTKPEVRLVLFDYTTDRQF